MRRLILILLALGLVGLTGHSVAAEPSAFLRSKDGNFYVAVKGDPPLWNGLNSKKERVASPDVVIGRVVASVFQKGKLVASVIGPPDSYGSDFTIPLPSGVLAGAFDPLIVAVQTYPVSETAANGFSAEVGTEVVAKLYRNAGNCSEGFPLAVELADADKPSPYARLRLGELSDYINGTLPTVQVQASTSPKAEPRDIKPDSQSFGNPGADQRVFRCLELKKDPPVGTFDIKLSYPANAPPELRRPLLKTGLVNFARKVTPFKLDDAQVGKRAIEQNLDVGVQFGSSVTDKKEKDANGVEVPVRKRDNKGTLDLRVAPLLNVLSIPDPGSETFHFLTPLLIDARVSTGKINEDTLSLNRIVFGGEYEIRHYTDPSTYPTYQRYIFSFRNASDRDFKQAEWKGGFEFQPVFSALNRPLRFRRKIVTSVLDPDPNRDPTIVPTIIGFGWQFLPLAGVEMGKTWRNKSPFAKIEQTEFVRRFYFGATLNLDLTSFVRISAKDILYIRGEAKEDRRHNYFLVTIEMPLPSFGVTANSGFLSFERGGQPPFATPDVNAFKVGYRLQWDGWFGQRR
jgi:hypothetical protein